VSTVCVEGSGLVGEREDVLLVLMDESTKLKAEEDAEVSQGS
jgi:hypothetical protein